MRTAVLSSIVVCCILDCFSICGQELQQPNHVRRRSASFTRVFAIRGIEFSPEQQAKVDELREQYMPKLIEIQNKHKAVEVDNLSDEYEQRLADVRRERTSFINSIQRELHAILTDAQRSSLGRPDRNQNRQRATAPTHANVSYGPSHRNLIDVWLAESDRPTPVLVSIHGGGFRGGNKSVHPLLLQECLSSGISVVAITYRLSGEAIAPAQFHDAARAIQFVRHNANAWNIDSARIASTGGSAGAGLSLWLGFHDDMADPDNDDLVRRQSTRLACMVVHNGQTSYDPRVIRDLFPGTDTYKHPALAQLYDVDLDKLDDLPAEKYKLFEEVSPLPQLSRDDPPALLFYAGKMDNKITSQGNGIHHPRFGKLLKEKMDPLGIECQVQTDIRPGGEESTGLTIEFIKKHFALSQTAIR